MYTKSIYLISKVFSAIFSSKKIDQTFSVEQGKIDMIHIVRFFADFKIFPVFQ